MWSAHPCWQFGVNALGDGCPEVELCTVLGSCHEIPLQCRVNSLGLGCTDPAYSKEKSGPYPAPER